VHVTGKDHEAIFKLHCAEGKVDLRENYGFSRRELAKIATALALRLKHLCTAWSKIHD